MKFDRNLIIIVPILSILFGVSVLNAIDIDSKMSESEHRNLAQKPNIFDIKDRTYPKDFDEYYTDQFVGRDKFLKLYTKLQLNSNKTYVKNYYVNEDNWILESLPNNVNTEELEDNINIIKNFINVNNSSDIYYISLPHKINVLEHLYPKFEDRYKNLENKKNYFLSKLEKNNINIIDIEKYFEENFSDKELESFYFKTDHHWSSVGAFNAFKKVMENICGIDNKHEIWSKYIYKNIKPKKFIGSYNRNLYNLIDEEEQIPYVYNSTDVDYQIYRYKSNSWIEESKENIWATHVFKNEENVTYGGVYTEDTPGYYMVKNKEAVLDKKVLIFRDSYHGAMAWMFSDIFKTVEVVDSRHIEWEAGANAKEVMSKTDADYVFIMLNDYGFNRIIPTLE